MTTSCALALGACTSLTESNPVANRYGSISIRAQNAANSRATANATAIIFEAYTAAVPNSALQQSDQCVYAAVDTATPVVRGVKKAGAQVSLAFGGSTVNLPYDDLNFRYANPANTPFSYAAGDVVQASIPGDGTVFPSATISVRLAEPLIPGGITVPTGTTPMAFSWNASNDSTAAIILSLRYANPATSSYANEQIYCSLRDDGAHQLPTSALAAFLASPNAKRTLQLTRWRTRETIIDARTILHIATSVDTTMTFPP
ncbi:MAG: hypothetical protein IPP90_18640 [Gemmatimonadaceae bacterium]|nr:hypothetical protein [Gemmatimonadaceae bacterium]